MRLAMKIVALAMALWASGTMAQGTNPPSSPTSPRQPIKAPLGVIKAVVVKSWGSGANASSLVWDYLNANWPAYGSIPIFIDASTLSVGETFTLADLESSGADVVIVSDPAGGLRRWTASEVAALASYVNQGHPLIGTFLIMQWDTVDNRILAPLWGLKSELAYSTVGAAPSAEILAQSNCLFDNIVDPLNQGGWPYVGVPADDSSWDPADLAGASFVARSADGHNVVTTYTNGNLHACYISYMPEYQSGGDFDATQYLYNAIVCQFGATPTVKSSWGRLKATYR